MQYLCHAAALGALPGLCWPVAVLRGSCMCAEGEHTLCIIFYNKKVCCIFFLVAENAENRIVL